MNAFTIIKASPEKTYRRKFQEMWLAREMERRLSKPEILELYLNRISLGPRVFGVEAAAEKYFGKSARDITLSEAALLAALPPTIIGDSETLIDPNHIGHVFDFIAEQAQGLVGSQHKDLIIKTTLDTKLQKQAHASVTKILEKNEKHKKVTEGALVSIDTQSGAVRAMIGGRSYQDSKFNRAAQAKRQPGSSFKAFVYAAALEDGFTPGTIRIDQPTEIAGWEPENYTQRYRGPMSIREALKLSINTIAAQVGAEVGPTRVAAIANSI